MKREYQKYFKMCVLVASMLLGTMMTSCERDYEISVIKDPETQEEQQEKERQEEELDATGKKLSTIPGITDVAMWHDILSARTGYTFFVNQYIDNSDPTKGTFKQRCILLLTDLAAPVMLYTNGDILEYLFLDESDVAKHLNANELYVEHRYFGNSLPEDINNISFTYLNAGQAAADLHRVVTLMKQHLFTTGNKWVSTGIGKSGINTTLYAYYSDKNGWDDIDLYIPFCAPFLQGTDQSAGDKAIGTYLKEVCGSGYPAGSDQDKAYQRLRSYPAAIANDKVLRDACLKIYNQKEPNYYMRLLRNHPADIEKAATAGILFSFYTNLEDKFGYSDFNSWCSTVPDPENFNHDQPELDYRLVTIVQFIFTNGYYWKEFITYTNDLNVFDEQDEDEQISRAGYTVEEIRSLRNKNRTMPSDIQAFREFGTTFYDFSLLPEGSFVTPEYCDQTAQQNLGVVANYADVYQGQWDGGRLMKDVRSWVNNTNKHIAFVYCTNDPWTGGAIDSDNPWGTGTVAANPANANVSIITSKGGFYCDSFLDTKSYTPEASNAIKQVLDRNILGK